MYKVYLSLGTNLGNRKRNIREAIDKIGELIGVVEFIQLARPTLSLAKYLQQVGRGMRVFEGKKSGHSRDSKTRQYSTIYKMLHNSVTWDYGAFFYA